MFIYNNKIQRSVFINTDKEIRGLEFVSFVKEMMFLKMDGREGKGEENVEDIFDEEEID